MSGIPRTERFCLTCMKMTKFEYNVNRFHSECIECGGFACCKDEEEHKTYLRLGKKGKSKFRGLL